MEFKDYYQQMGVPEDADSAAIKKAYRKLARKYHPDVSKEENAEARFKEIGEAYEVLKDPEKRAEYDQLKAMGGVGPDGQYQPPPDWESNAGFSSGGYTHVDAAQFSDFFESIFGRGGTERGPGHREGFQQAFRARGEDIHYKMALFLEDLYKETETVIEVSVPAIDARGHVSHQTKKLKVKIPAGVGEGQHIRLKGQGSPGAGGGEAGDLFVEIQLAPHPRYRVEGKHVYCDLELLPWEAALGGRVEFETPSGKVKLKINPNSQSGQRYRLSGKGIPGKSPGDFYAEVKIVLPPELTDKAKDSYEKLAQDYSYNPRG